jgi:hypothetical protein
VIAGQSPGYVDEVNSTQEMRVREWNGMKCDRIGELEIWNNLKETMLKVLSD